MASIKILSAVLCDEVRREASGTAMVVGATPIGAALATGRKNEIDRVSLFIEVALTDANSLRVRLCNLETGFSPIEQLLNLPYKEQITEDDPEAEIEKIQVVAMLVINRTNVEFGDPGLYTLQYKLNDEGEWTNIREFLFPEAESDDE